MRGKPGFFLLSITSGLLLSLAWYWRLSICVFFAFVPLLLLEDAITSTNSPKRRLKLFGFTYLCFLSWNILVTWWVVYASFGGACMAFIFNSLFMALVFMIFSGIKNRLNKSWSIWLLILLWIAWEHGHTLWDLSWTWLTLGNVFSFNTQWVQWYEFTGTSGGTLWILAVNILIFQVIKNNPSLKLISLPVLKIAVSIILPILFSYLLLFLRKESFAKEKRTSVPVVIVQPNIDPYNVKFYLNYQSQFFKMLNLLKGKIKPETEYLVLPETFITGVEGDMNEEILNQYDEIQWFRDSLISYFPNLKIITGANSYVFYQSDKISSTARKDTRSGKHYDAFNTAIFIDQTGTQIYHKSKLVPGVERMPFPALLKPLESLAINMGGTMGSLGTQEERTVFNDAVHNDIIAPVICYESVYADYLTEYIRKGANLIFIITNDGWWENTPGYIQHLNYGRLRAIENRRQIARCANTGISCFIDEFGNIYNATNWWEEAVISRDLYKNDQLTFFSRFGDLISYTSVVLSILLILFALFLRFKK
jgi:apolipoprotein N-acyltransferase